MKVAYNRVVQSRAGRKCPNQQGLSLTVPNMQSQQPVVRLQCINAKLSTITTDLYMEIPLEDIDKVIDCLETIKQAI